METKQIGMYENWLWVHLVLRAKSSRQFVDFTASTGRLSFSVLTAVETATLLTAAVGANVSVMTAVSVAAASADESVMTAREPALSGTTDAVSVEPTTGEPALSGTTDGVSVEPTTGSSARTT